MPDTIPNLWYLHPDADVDVCVLFGGPRDGDTYDMRNPPARMHFTLPLPLTPAAPDENVYHLNPHLKKAYEYRLVFRGLHPSRDDRGRLTYVYRGIVGV